ncbi:MAG: hypoxanthine phosphoribosyltransferase [Halobacteriovoraceae bacterium]|mgnify:FL=1|jgi:hypoxanthine phosphoribosyltransferase|nr:hypoxanthine phosphoribosyltransferase [Halobacteriovoraceae bacterium]MBT5093111.1 hypoxanthine phosphoribosyltransferase [Halobacteriovoraceae bacterium]
MAVDVLISQEKIAERVAEIGALINSEYAGKELVVIGILNGACLFTADLIRQINVPITLEFMSVSSYGEATKSSGNVKINLDCRNDIAGKHVLVVEDIVDTGLTMLKLRETLVGRGPASFKLASLLFKPARNLHKVEINYLAFEIEDKFVIGYGLDYAGKYRELPYIGVYSE